MRAQIASDQVLPSMVQAALICFIVMMIRIVHARRARAPPSWFSYVERRRRSWCWKEYTLSNGQKQPISWTQCFKESFFHFGLCSFSTSVSPSSSPFLLSFPYPVTLSVTLLHCNVRGFARRRTCWTFKSRLGDQKLDVTSHLNRKKEV